MHARATKWLVVFATAVSATPSVAGTMSKYLRTYQPGIEVTSSSTTSTLTYEAPIPQGNAEAEGCTEFTERKGVMTCSVTLLEPGELSFGFFIQPAFKRKGLFLLDADLAFSVVTLDASLGPPPPSTVGKPSPPLRSARIHLYGINSKGYVTIGLTPKILPDILFSFGLGVQLAGGNLSVHGVRKDLTVVAPLTYGEFEIVWARFGDGALSTYVSGESGFTGDRSLYSRPIDGMESFRMQLASASIGLIKFVLPFP